MALNGGTERETTQLDYKPMARIGSVRAVRRACHEHMGSNRTTRLPCMPAEETRGELMSMGSKHHGPSLPGNVSVTRNSKHPKFAKSRTPKARSPRVVAEIHSQGISGRNGDNTAPTVTRGIDRDTDMRAAYPKVNTNANRRNGGQGISYYDPEELARESLTRSSAPSPSRVNGRRLLAGQREKINAAAEAEGFRQRAMKEHSLMTRHGAIGTTTEMMRIPDGYWPNGEPKYRLIPVVVPFWEGDMEETEES